MLLRDYIPQSKLVVTETKITTPRFPVIDTHNHLGGFDGVEWEGWYKRPASELLDLLDEVHVETYIILDGGWGEDILRHDLDKYKAAAPERFAVFGGVDWGAWPIIPMTSANGPPRVCDNRRLGAHRASRSGKTWDWKSVTPITTWCPWMTLALIPCGRPPAN